MLVVDVGSRLSHPWGALDASNQMHARPTTPNFGIRTTDLVDLPQNVRDELTFTLATRIEDALAVGTYVRGCGDEMMGVWRL